MDIKECGSGLGSSDKKKKKMPPPVVEWYYGKDSMTRAVAAGRASQHHTFAACDSGTDGNGTKSYASFPSHVELFEAIERLPPPRRNVYELILPDTRVCLWFDIEFYSGNEGDGETMRAQVGAVLHEAILASFHVESVRMLWGTSTRLHPVKQIWKHSYQLRVPCIQFDNNHKDGLLSKWVRAFVHATPALCCPVTKKHVVDVAVYSRARYLLLSRIS